MTVFYVGSYTEMITDTFGGKGSGIYTVSLDDTTGKLRCLYATESLNPAYLALSEDKRYLYTITEVESKKEPKVKAFKIYPDFSLSLINEVSIPGSLPCHIACQGKHIFIACYGTGNMLHYNTTNEGALLECNQNFKHSGSSINKVRQEGPHAHQVVIHPNNTTLFVPDLGIDQVKAYQFEQNVLRLNHSQDIQIPAGFGPRHLVFNRNGDLGYVFNELTAEISIIKQNEYQIFRVIDNVKTLPDSFQAIPSASAIRLHPNGQFLYVANRTLNALTIFKIKDSHLELLGYQYGEGTTLREFNISPNGKWLIACFQDSDDTIVYKIKEDGLLHQVFKTKLLVSPVCVAFL
ncbi:lactonase family protein [Tamlana fucoidanivorans]|uniref:Lactonase family protein n=1 Tax=Allotamlana fucoidanivorans TaxID=2583814 RepID=A0A5C4SQM9_9FLAO|nr:lactonase family protein [Tamlana fucoidanivorans]TNJ46582.1 lactonase family protein [Tamlana fucoidanivorans]